MQDKMKPHLKKISPSRLKEKGRLNREVFLKLPANEKFLLVAHRGDEIRDELMERILKENLDEVYVSIEENEASDPNTIDLWILESPVDPTVQENFNGTTQNSPSLEKESPDFLSATDSEDEKKISESINTAPSFRFNNEILESFSQVISGLDGFMQDQGPNSLAAEHFSDLFFELKSSVDIVLEPTFIFSAETSPILIKIFKTLSEMEESLNQLPPDLRFQLESASQLTAKELKKINPFPVDSVSNTESVSLLNDINLKTPSVIANNFDDSKPAIAAYLATLLAYALGYSNQILLRDIAISAIFFFARRDQCAIDESSLSNLNEFILNQPDSFHEGAYEDANLIILFLDNYFAQGDQSPVQKKFLKKSFYAALSSEKFKEKNRDPFIVEKWMHLIENQTSKNALSLCSQACSSANHFTKNLIHYKSA